MTRYKKKVLVDLFYLNTALTGVKTYISEFYEAVGEAGFSEVDFIFTHDFQKQSSSQTFKGNTSRIKKLWYHVYYFLWKQVALPFQVWKHKPDVLLCFDFVAPAIPLSVKKLIVIHDAFFWQIPENYAQLWRKYFIKTITLGLGGNSLVITTSEYSRRSLISEAKIQRPIQVIYQCPKLLSDLASKDIIKTLNLKQDKFFLHVGSFDKRKMLPILVAAFHRFKSFFDEDIKLVLVGERGLSPTVDDYENVEMLIKNNRLEKDVLLPGFLSDTELKALYQQALCYVFPSSNEGFGIPVIEAMHNQLPVIISDQEALIEIAGGAALITKTGDVEDLSQAMRLIFNDQNLRMSLIQKGLNRKKLFTRSTFYNSFYKLF